MTALSPVGVWVSPERKKQGHLGPTGCTIGFPRFSHEPVLPYAWKHPSQKKAINFKFSISPLFFTPHVGPQWVIWLEYRGSTECKYKYEHGEEYRESNAYDDPYQHVCTTPKVYAVRIICIVRMYVVSVCMFCALRQTGVWPLKKSFWWPVHGWVLCELFPDLPNLVSAYHGMLYWPWPSIEICLLHKKNAIIREVNHALG